MSACHRQIILCCMAFVFGCSEPEAPAAPAHLTQEFIGSEVCQTCHEPEYSDWLGSQHQLAMQVADHDTVLGDFSGVEFEYFGSTTRFLTRESDFLVRTQNADGQQQDFLVTHTFGIDPLQQYLVEFPGGRLQALPFAWDTRASDDGGQRWFHLYPDDYTGPGDPLHWTGSNLNWNYMCAECHSTDVKLGYDAGTDTFDTTFEEISVACEACHGPGSAHAAQASSGTFDSDFGLPVSLDDRGNAAWVMNPDTGIAKRSEPSRQQQTESCGRCHARRSVIAPSYEYGRPLTDTHMPALLAEQLYFADGQIQGEVYVYGSFLQSAMYRAGVTCTDCHNPHSGKLVTGPDPNDVCSQCHLTTRFTTAKHGRSGSRAGLCVGCHMPSRTYMGVDDRRDHSFRILSPDVGAHYGAAIAAGRKGSANDTLIAAISNTDFPAIARATMLTLLEPAPETDEIETLRSGMIDRDPLIRIAALRALRQFPAELRLQFGGDLLDDPVRGVRLQAALAVADLHDLLPASAAREFPRAAEEYRQALLAAANRPESMANLADFELRTGNTSAAARYFDLAIALGPGDAAIHHAYGLFLIRINQRDDALEELRRAAELEPTNSRNLYVLGVALNSLGLAEQALTLLHRAREDFPHDFDIAWALATMLRDSGDIDKARRLIDDMSTQFPDNEDIEALRQSLSQ